MAQQSPPPKNMTMLATCLNLLLLFSSISRTDGFAVPKPQSPKWTTVLYSSTETTADSSETYKAPLPEINRRRNLAIISHPDSGKTTMTEKLLLYGGAVQQAGAVRQKAEQRATQSDFMEMEQERGISISSTVMNFDYKDNAFVILDTPVRTVMKTKI